jgi:predicted dehydrogenase
VTASDEAEDGHEPILRIAVAGFGSMGRNHVRNLAARHDVRIVAVADPEESARLEAAHQIADVATFADPHQMLASIAMDAIVVAIPTTLHSGVAIDAIERHVAVLVEKPIAPTVAEGRRMVEAAKANDVLLQVGHIERFNPAVLELTRRLRGGALSRIFSVRTIRGGPTPERIQDVGVGVDLATHDVDIICHLLENQPIRIYAEATRHVHTAHEDLVYGLLTFPGGVLGQIDVNWLTPEKQRRIVVLGEEGMFDVDYLTQALHFTRGREELAPTYLDGYAPMIRGERRALPVAPAEPLRRELEAFVTAVRAGGPAAVTGEDGVRAIALATMLLRSAVEHRPIEIGAGDLG